MANRHLQGPRYVNVSKHVIHALTSLSTWNSATRCDTLGIETKTKQYVFCHSFSGILACSSATTALPNRSSFPKTSSLVAWVTHLWSYQRWRLPKGSPTQCQFEGVACCLAKQRFDQPHVRSLQFKHFQCEVRLWQVEFCPVLRRIISTLHQTTPQKKCCYCRSTSNKKGVYQRIIFLWSCLYLRRL